LTKDQQSKLKQILDLVELIDLAQWELKQGHNIEACETCQSFINEIKNLTSNFRGHSGT